MSFGFTSIEHAFATVARDIAKGIGIISTDAPIVEGVVETVTAVLDPPAVVVERAAFSGLGTILGALNKAQADTTSAVASKGLNVTFDSAAVADFKAVLAACKSELIAVGVLKA